MASSGTRFAASREVSKFSGDVSGIAGDQSTRENGIEYIECNGNKQGSTMKDKSFINLAKALPALASMEQTRGLLRTFVKQWGVMNALRILFATGKKTGHVRAIKFLLNFRLEKLTPNFLIFMWEVFGEREAIISQGTRFTYLDLKDRVFRLANALQSLGLEPRDRCA